MFFVNRYRASVSHPSQCLSRHVSRQDGGSTAVAPRREKRDGVRHKMAARIDLVVIRKSGNRERDIRITGYQKLGYRATRKSRTRGSGDWDIGDEGVGYTGCLFPDNLIYGYPSTGCPGNRMYLLDDLNIMGSD